MKKKLLMFFLCTGVLLQSPAVIATAADTDIETTAEPNTSIETALTEQSDMDTEEPQTIAEDAFPTTKDGFSYMIQADGSVAIMKYNGTQSNVTVPSHINGKPVTTIGNSAFAQNNLEVPLTSITLPDTLTTIYDYVFAFNDSLTEITIPDSVNWIGESVFTGCGLTDIRLPKNLTVLNAYLFMDCTSLQRVILPEGITDIRRSAFANCYSLNKLNIPNNVKTIDDNVFAHCIELADLFLPANITLIGSSAFYDCGNLTLHVPENSYALQYAEQYGYPYILRENAPYTDVQPEDWYYNYVNWAYTNHLMTGYENGNFGPADLLTRGQFALILYRYEGEPAVSEGTPFPDVEAGLYYSDAVTWAKDAGIIGGYENGDFGPVDHMNREQLATMMYRYAKTKGYDTSARADLNAFPDAFHVNTFAEGAMQWAVAEGLITGDNGKLNPQGNANRAETSTIFYRFVLAFE